MLAACGWLGLSPLAGGQAPRLDEREIGPDPALAQAYHRLLAAVELASEGASRELLELAEFYHANAFLRQAMQCYDRVWETTRSADGERACYLAACAAEALGELERARERLEALVDGEAAYPAAQLRLARLLAATGQRERAAQLFERCMEKAETEEGAAIGLAKLALRDGAQREAERQLLQCLRRNPDCGDAALLLSNVYAALGDERRSQEFLLRGQRSPRHTSTADRWLDALSDRAFGEYRLACDADELFTALRFTEARTVFERALTLYPASSDLWLGLAKLEFASDRRGAAFAAVERAVDCAKPSEQAFAIFAEELYRDAEHEGALAVCRRAASRGVDSARSELVAANAWLALGERAKAREVFAKAAESFPHAANLLESSADLARSEGDFALARDLYERAVSMRPFAPSLRAKRLAVLLALRDWNGAESVLARLEQQAVAGEALPRLRSKYWQARALDYRERDDRQAWLDALSRAFACDSQREVFKLVSSRLIEAEEWESLVELALAGRESLPGCSLVAKVEGVAKLQLGQFQQGLERLRAARDLAVEEGRLEEAERIAAMIAELQEKAGSV